MRWSVNRVFLPLFCAAMVAWTLGPAARAAETAPPGFGAGIKIVEYGAMFWILIALLDLGQKGFALMFDKPAIM